ncbi:hypothetical protein C8A01DRAFT_34705 [Parachaetomium inaequale]|uniref:Thioredoxin-like fold domain-containing protein n=1 Tax=Parachaetomium inaequale TaxID=2588326 RepID=A0AAN6PLH1_9PEZI|nr:hypothetical protein C8A01DRAFT_34705 [Parachaetomium inaequale]
MAAPKVVPSLTVYRGFPARGCYTPSPFVNKLETRLRIGGLSYRVEMGSVPKAPRGKIPYVDVETSDPSKPEQLSDSTFITRRFVEDGHLADLNAALMPAERARDLGVRALFEDRLCFYQGRERWIDNYYAMRDNVLGFMPFLVRFVVGLLAYRSHKRTLQGHGVLRYTDDEFDALRREVWDSLNAMLVESRGRAHEAGRAGPFWVLGGAAPTEADATVFGFITASLDCKQAPASEKIVRGLPVVMDYAGRIHDRYFADYKRWSE